MDSRGDDDKVGILESGSGGHHEPRHHDQPHLRHTISSLANIKILMLIGLVALVYIVLNQSSSTYPFQLFRSSYLFSGDNNDHNKMQQNVSSSSNDSVLGDLNSTHHQQSTNHTLPSHDNEEEEGLEQLLKRAAMPNKTVIITPLNEAWIEPDSIFDVFLESFRTGDQILWLLRHILVINLDQKAYDHCLNLYLHCYFLKTEGEDFSGEAHFMTPGYLKIVWRKIDFLRIVLELGYNFIFTDADIVWFRNPFPHLHPNADLQVACDYFGGNASDLKNGPNTGFMYVKSCNQTIEFYKYWYKSRELHPGIHDQDALNAIKFDPFMKEIGLEMKFLDTLNFGGFCQPSRDLNLVCTMHANCCAGLDNKIHDLKILLEDWRKYRALPDDERLSHPPSWTVPKKCGPPSFQHHTPRKRNGSKN